MLTATIVGSGVLAAGMAGGAYAVALIGSTIAVASMLYMLETALAPVSGCHLNPAVTLPALLRREIGWRDAALYMAVQAMAAVVGVWFAHAMFELPVIQVAAAVAERSAPGKLMAEAAATYALVFAIYAVSATNPKATGAAVALTIAAGIWWTASSSFANPAITLARAFSDSFAGIRPVDVPGFIAAQLAGAVLAERSCRWLFADFDANRPIEAPPAPEAQLRAGMP